MEDNKIKETFSYLDDEDLNFTETDRQKTFNRIKKRKLSTKKNFFLKFSPAAAFILVIILAVGSLLPTLLSENKNGAGNQQASDQNDDSFALMLIGEGENKRTSVNILLTYNGNENSMKIVPMYRDTYVPIIDSEGKTIKMDKLTHVTAYSDGIESVGITISKLFDVPIDYYASISLDSLADSLDIDESFRENQLVDKVKNNLTADDISDLVTESFQTNLTEEHLKALKGPINSLEIINLYEAIEMKMVEGVYYLDIDESTLNEISEVLNKHLDNK